jgi:integrase
MRLTDRTIATLQCPPGKKDAMFFDDAEAGFAVRVTKDGRRVMLFQYRAGRHVRRQRIGVWGESLTEAKARKIAQTVRGKVNEGRDPVKETKVARAAEAAAEAAAKVQQTADAFTFYLLVDDWQARGLASKRPRYRDDAVKRLRAYFKEWEHRPARSITRTEAMAAVDALEGSRGTISARRALAYARACYGWAVARNMLDQNPFKGLVAPGKETQRDRVLNDAEIGAVWRAAPSLGPVYGAYVRLLMLTLQRREELSKARWSEFSDDHTVWTVPADRAKNGKAHVVHLPKLAQDILLTLPRIQGNPLVFPGKGNREITVFSGMKKTLDAAIKSERIDAGLTPIEIVGWRLHDFRRTGVTTLANLGFAPHVCDRLLNHLTGAIQGVAKVYQKAEFRDEREAALEAWASHVENCSLGKDAQGKRTKGKAAA